MSNKKNYPLLPGQTHIEPYYTQVPTEEYEANMRELKQLRELTAGSRTTIDDIAEIKTLTSEVNALREMNAKAQEEIAALKENQRWRNFPDEKPSEEMEGEDCIVSNGFYAVVCEWRGYWNNEPFCGDRHCDEVKYWRPLPLEPKEEK